MRRSQADGLWRPTRPTERAWCQPTAFGQSLKPQRLFVIEGFAFSRSGAESAHFSCREKSLAPSAGGRTRAEQSQELRIVPNLGNYFTLDTSSRERPNQAIDLKRNASRPQKARRVGSLNELHLVLSLFWTLVPISGPDRPGSLFFFRARPIHVRPLYTCPMALETKPKRRFSSTMCKLTPSTFPPHHHTHSHAP